MRQRRIKVVILHLMLVLAIGLGGFQAALPAGIALAQGNPPNGGSGQSVFLPSIGVSADSTAPTQSLPTDVLDVVVQASPTMLLSVVSARDEPRAFGGAGVNANDVVSTYKYIINLDNTGTTTQTLSPDCSPTSPGYPGSCNWVSVAGAATSSPIVTQGDQNDFAGGSGLQLPPGRYLISVLADGYKLDGVHFVIPDPAPIDPPVAVRVELQPTPLPTATISAFIFEDISPTNSAPDVPAEHGLNGFEGHILDYLGEVTTDVFGNPLCTEYVKDTNGNIVLDPPDYEPTPIPGTGGVCKSGPDIYNPDRPDGYLEIPNLGPNRYALSAVAPDGTKWIQTTTLEGNHDWDAWVMEGATGLDTEFVVAGEPFPAVFFGFVKPTAMPPNNGSGEIKGVVDAIKVYYPPKGGIGLPGTVWGGTTGERLDKPIEKLWLALTDLNNGDTAIWVGQGNEDGSFSIPNVPAGDYTLTWWDEPQDYILDLLNVSVANGEVVDLGVLPLAGWWTFYDGYVFADDNRNGIMDWQDTNGNGCPDPGEGELGVPGFGLTMRKRENSLMDRGATAVSTDACGYYSMENAYPMTQWLVMEAYHDQYYTTGVTYQADNQPDPTTVLGAGVDVSVLPIIGLSGRLDWGVHAYDATGANGIDPQNGGIVGTVSYDTTRNELDPQFAAVEDWQPGVPDLTVNLYATVQCGTDPTKACDPLGLYQLDRDGSYEKGPKLYDYVTETWERPTGCVARDVDGNPLTPGTDEQVLPTGPDAECLEGPLMGNQFQTGFSSVDGNYGFGSIWVFDNAGQKIPDPQTDSGFAEEPIPAGAYLVEVEIPNDAFGRPLYQVTREEDINIANGDQYVPQVPPPACAGPLHQVDNAGLGTDNYPPFELLPYTITVAGSNPVDNATIGDLGGNPYEGQARRLCDTKLVELSNGKSIVPTFNLYTEVPIPGRFWGLLVDDLNFSADPKSLLVGEKAGIPFAPVGIYDYQNRLITTVESDYNGLFDVLLPSTNRISCPTPSGVCANLYRFVGNDPGIPGRLNPNYNPQFRTIAAEFEAFPGLLVPADLAPTQVGVTVQLPGGQSQQPVTCKLDATTPQLFAVSQPYVNISNAGVVSPSSITIEGMGFGNTAGSVTLEIQNGASTALAALTVSFWSDTQIVLSVPAGTPVGPHQLAIKSANGESTINGLTFHVVGGSYTPVIREVGPGKPYAKIQDAIDAAEAANTSGGNNNSNIPDQELVVVYPGQPDLDNPRGNPYGSYYENLVINQPVKLQGVGPGGFQPDAAQPSGFTFVAGSIIDGGAFGGDTTLADAWRTKVAGLNWDGNQNVSEAAGIYILARSNNTQNVDYRFTDSYKAGIDGFDIRGGNQMGFPTNINEIGGGPTGLPPATDTQGGAIFANAYASYLQITNNTIQNNGGTYATVRIGTPNLPAPDTDNHNDHIQIAHNRVFANGGTNLAGGIGLFAGANNYDVAYNDICGNFSAEYGGGVSVYGLSPDGKIHDNRIYFNRSYDEGAGVFIAGELPANPAALSPGSGPVDIYDNLIQANLANDDGGGIRFLMAGNFPMNVYNNMIVNNISTHEGGGVALDDAPNVRFYNNTVMKNMTTATTVTSNGSRAPAGLSTGPNSAQLQATLPGGSPTFSNPLLFNNIFWDNRAGTRTGGGVTGLGAAGDATPIDNWDMGSVNAALQLAPTNSVLQTTESTIGDPTNSLGNPNVVAEYDVSVTFAAWRNNPAFIGAIMIATELPANLLGNYHVQTGSPALNLGAVSKASVNAPNHDIDHDARPMDGGYDSGADELHSTGDTIAPVITLLGGDPLDNQAATMFAGGSYVEPGATATDNIDGDITAFIVVSSDLNPYVEGDYTTTYNVTDKSGNAATEVTRTVHVVPPPQVYFSTDNNNVPPGIGGFGGDDADIYWWSGSAFSRVVNASGGGSIGLPGGANVDGLEWVDATHFYLSFSGDTTVSVPGPDPTFQGEDVVYYDNGTWSLFFDGSAGGNGLGGGGGSSFDLDAISVVGGVLYFSTDNNNVPSGAGGTGDDADIYRWNPSSTPRYTRVWDASANGVPSSGGGNANVDGLQWVDATHLYLSFSGSTTVSVSGPDPTFQDEDVAYFNTGSWSPYFVGGDHGLGGSGGFGNPPAFDLDAISVP